MQTLRKYAPFFTSAFLMYLVLFIIYPHYQYYIDPDGTAYLTISKRYAAGDLQKAVNGYWSPWSCWLTALLVKPGLHVIPASVVINALGATGFLFISQSFFLRFNIVKTLQWLFNVTLALFLCFAIFWQSFDDLWECFFLLSALRIMLNNNFIQRPALWIASGLIGTLAYFAKAYSFPFFILNTIVCVYFICKDNKVQWLKISFTAIITMIGCSLPWIIALHNKYGIWATSTAGTLNMSWFLTGHPHWKQGIDLLIPPTYSDSPSYWEDPYFANGDTPHFWSSWYLFGRQFLRIGLNVWKFLVSDVQLSVFFPFIVLLAVLSFFHKKVKHFFSADARLLIVSFLLFPVAYFLVNFESRYLWYMVPLSMVIGGLLLQGLFYKGQYALYFLFVLSFLFYPVWGMYKMYDEGKLEFGIAQQIKRLNIQGSFTAIAKPGIETQRMQRIAYFSENQLYSFSRPQYTAEEVLQKIDHNTKYLFVFNEGYSLNNFIMPDGKTIIELTHGNIPGLHIFIITYIYPI